MNKILSWLVQRLDLRNLKIKNKLIIIYSVMISLAVLSICIFFYYNSTKIIRDKSIKYTLGILEQISNNIDINLEQIDLSSYIIFSNQSILNILQYGKSTLIGSDVVEHFNAEKILVDVMFSRRDIESIYLYDKKGNRIGTNTSTPSTQYEELYKQAEEIGGQFVWLDVDKEKGVIPAVRLVRNMVLDPVGVLLVNIRENSIRKMFSIEISKMKGQIYVINSKGIVLSSWEDRLIGTKLEDKIFNKIGDKSGYVIDTINNEKSIITFYPSRFNDWIYIGIIPMKEITMEAAQIGRVSIIASILSITLFIFISYMIVSGLINPIQQITMHMKEARIKDWSPQIDYRGNDEISYLSEAFNEMVKRINTLVADVVEQKSRGIRQELKALQAQINPHFLYNTLEVINWMARHRNVPEVGDIIKALSDIMRYCISHNEEIVIIEKEIQHVKNYCLIQMARYGDELNVFYDIDEEILDSNIQKLTLQPIVENAIVHGFNGATGKHEIKINGGIFNKKIRFQIIDNGIGMDEKLIEQLFEEKGYSKDDRHSSIGINNVNRRIKLMYGDEYGLKVQSRLNEGTTFEVWIPING